MKISFLAHNETAERNSCKIHYFSLNKLTQIIKKKSCNFPLRTFQLRLESKELELRCNLYSLSIFHGKKLQLRERKACSKPHHSQEAEGGTLGSSPQLLPSLVLSWPVGWAAPGFWRS